MNNIIKLADVPRQQVRCDDCGIKIPADECILLDGNEVLCEKCGGRIIEQAKIVAEMCCPMHRSDFGKTAVSPQR